MIGLDLEVLFLLRIIVKTRNFPVHFGQEI